MEGLILNFNYKGQELELQCKRNEHMNDIFKRYTNKIKKDINNIYFINNGNKIENNNIKVEEINNKENKINILDYDLDNNINEAIIKESKDIICQECIYNYLNILRNLNIKLKNQLVIY